jgi:hypothetical protein
VTVLPFSGVPPEPAITTSFLRWPGTRSIVSIAFSLKRDAMPASGLADDDDEEDARRRGSESKASIHAGS